MRLPHTAPVLLRLSIEVEHWRQFETAAEEHPEVHLIWDGPSSGGRKEVLVACADHDVAERLEDGWA